MEERFEVKLWVNNGSIELNEFVEKFLAKIVIGAASSLKGVNDVQDLELYMERNDVEVVVNVIYAEVAFGNDEPEGNA